jgi:hypothetical protein
MQNWSFKMQSQSTPIAALRVLYIEGYSIYKIQVNIQVKIQLIYSIIFRQQVAESGV